MSHSHLNVPTKYWELTKRGPAPSNRAGYQVVDHSESVGSALGHRRAAVDVYGQQVVGIHNTLRRGDSEPSVPESPAKCMGWRECGPGRVLVCRS